MGIDARRDHAIRIPRPDLTVKIGTPNVCSGCHADRTPEWAADAIARWYGPDRRHEAHYGEVLAAGRAGQRGAEESLLNLARDSSEPAIVRATALERPPALRAREPSGERRGHAGPRPRGADRCRGQPRARSSRRARVARRPVARRSGARRPHRGGACALVRAVRSTRCLAAPGGRAGRRGVHRRAERRPRPAGSTPEPGGAVREPGQARARGGTLPDRPSARPGLHSGAVEPRSSAE